jgi:hypothetical protein
VKHFVRKDLFSLPEKRERDNFLSNISYSPSDGVSKEGMKILYISLKRVFLINRDGAKCHGVPQQNNKNDPTPPPA